MYKNFDQAMFEIIKATMNLMYDYLGSSEIAM